MLGFRGLLNSGLAARAVAQGRLVTGVRNLSDYQQPQGRTNAERCINQVNLMGRVGSDPVSRGTDKYPVVMFTLATHHNIRYSESGEIDQKTQWHRISVFKPSLRGVCEDYLRKGARIYIQGRLSYGDITDNQGNTYQVTSVIADDLIFLSSKARARAEPEMDVEEPSAMP